MPTGVVRIYPGRGNSSPPAFSSSEFIVNLTATNLTVNGAVGGTGFTALFAAPPPIGSTTPNAGTFTSLSATGTISGPSFTAGNDPNGDVALGSVSIARTPYVDFYSTGSGTKGFRIISGGADELNLERGSDGVSVMAITASGVQVTQFGANGNALSGKITITGSRGGATATVLELLLQAMQTFGFVIDSTTP